MLIIDIIHLLVKYTNICTYNGRVEIEFFLPIIYVLGWVNPHINLLGPNWNKSTTNLWGHFLPTPPMVQYWPWTKIRMVLGTNHVPLLWWSHPIYSIYLSKFNSFTKISRQGLGAHWWWGCWCPNYLKAVGRWQQLVEQMVWDDPWHWFICISAMSWD